MPDASQERDRLVSLIGEIVDATGSTEALCAASLGTGEVIPSTAVISYQLDPLDGTGNGCTTDGGAFGGTEAIERLLANLDRCPINGWHADGNQESVVALSEITVPSEYRKADHYRSVFGGTGIQDILSIPVGSGEVTACVLVCRDAEGFTDREIEDARILQPVLAGCLRQTRVMEQLRADPLSEAAMRERGLTAREAQIFTRLAAGATSQAVAQQLDISVRTVEKHVQNIYARIGARNRSEAISILLGNGSAPVAA